ncbi:MAG: aminotransferase class V-fold PLP-dependent enzyme, partial [Caldilineaceae bacterium]|nr:aminotransferase class V-fold PLP-dependent enzyme [Caldilineaceae bacterium]
MLDVQAIRQQFPALREQYHGRPATFFDNPGGTQVHESVIQAMTSYLTRRNSNTHGVFETSRRTDEIIDQARRAAGDLLGAAPDEVVFGNNMTSLTFALSHALAHEFGPDDEIVVTRLDHDANVWPWVMMAEDTGAQVRWVDIDMESCTLDMEHFQSLIGPKTRLVAVGYASNAVGTINDVKTVIGWAKAAGAYTFVDAVQFAPHG